MSDKQETTDDIIREMRELGALDEKSVDMIPRSLQALGLRTYADRIEAARKREQADPLAKPNLCRSCKHLLPDGCEICGCGDYVEAAERERVALVAEAEAAKDAWNRVAVRLGVQYAERCRECKAGNAAALRKALEDTEELLEHFAKPGTMLHSAFSLHMRDNRAALAAPPRNCDRFKPADEARMAFWDTHETIWDAFKNRGGTELFYEVLDWLFAPAEGKEASNG